MNSLRDKHVLLGYTEWVWPKNLLTEQFSKSVCSHTRVLRKQWYGKAEEEDRLMVDGGIKRNFMDQTILKDGQK